MTESQKIEFYEHPEYLAKKDLWQTCRDLYEGKHEVVTQAKYLPLHELETSNEPFKVEERPDGTTVPSAITVGQFLRKTRCQRTQYDNYTEPVVSTFISLIFKSEITPDEQIKSLFEEELSDIDGSGQSLEDFIKGSLAIAYFRDGQPILYVDAPKAGFVNKTEEKAAGFRPYFEILDVLSVKDWQIQDEGPARGEYEILRWEYCSIDKRTSLNQQPTTSEYTKVISIVEGNYTIETFKKTDGNWTPYGEVRTLAGFDELPISTVWGNEPWIKDVVGPQLEILNLNSWKMSVLGSSAFQRVLISAENLNQKHRISVSEYAWGILPRDANVHVIEPASVDGLRQAALEALDKLFRVAYNRSRGVSASSQEAPGADTLREMKDELIALLVSAIGEMESMVNEAFEYAARLKGKKDFTGKVTFPRDITIADVDKQLEVFAAYRDQIMKVQSWRKAELRRVALEGPYSDEEKEEISKEIDELKEEPLPTLGGAVQPFVKKGINGGRGGQPTDAPNASKPSVAEGSKL